MFDKSRHLLLRVCLSSVSQTKFGVTLRCHLILIDFFPSANTLLILCKKFGSPLISLQCKGCASEGITVQRSNFICLSHRWKFLKDKAVVCRSPCRRSIAQVTAVTASDMCKGTLGSGWGFAAVGTTKNGKKVCYKGYLCLFDMYLLFDSPVASSNCSKNTQWKTRMV